MLDEYNDNRLSAFNARDGPVATWSQEFARGAARSCQVAARNPQSLWLRCVGDGI